MNCRKSKMAGKKGRSGRKARTDGKTMRAVSLYIPMEEIDTAHMNKGYGKYEWIPESWFRKFKRYFGARWQDEVRRLMSDRVKQYQEQHLWKCRCVNEVVAWHKPNVDHCPQCSYRPTPYERYKSYAKRLVNEQQPKVAEGTIDLCPVCKDSLEVEVTKWGKAKYCKSCNPNRSTL
jgi:hypothetical protein